MVSVIPPRPSKLDREPFHTLQIGAKNLTKYIIDPAERKALGLKPTRKTKEYKAPAQVVGMYEKQGVAPKAVLKEFRVTEDALLPIG